MKARAALVTAGLSIMAYAAVGALADPDLKPGGVLIFLAGVLVGHDAIVMPIVLAAGAVLIRLVPQRHRPVAQVAAVSVAAVTFVAIPLVLGFGRPADNPSVLPLPYGRNLAITLVIIAGATLLTRLRPARRDRPPPGRKKSESPAGPDADHADR